MNRLSSIILAVCLGASWGWSAEPIDNAALYKAGKAAYENEDYVTALKQLYAYSLLEQEKLAATPEFHQALLQIIDRCEQTVRLSILTNDTITIGTASQNRGIQINTNGIRGTGREIDDILNQFGVDPTTGDFPGNDRDFTKMLHAINKRLSPSGPSLNR